DLLNELRKVYPTLLRFRTPDPRKCEKVINQIAHFLGRIQDHRKIAVAFFIETARHLLLQQFCVAGHVPQWRAKVMRDGVGERLKLPVHYFQLGGTPCQFLVDALQVIPGLAQLQFHAATRGTKPRHQQGEGDKYYEVWNLRNGNEEAEPRLGKVVVKKK